MKYCKRTLIGTLLLTIFLINIVVPASAYSYSGYMWKSHHPYIQKGSTIPSSWSSALTASTNTWDNAGANFSFHWGQTAVNKLNYKSFYPTSTLGITFPVPNADGYLGSCYTNFNSNVVWSTSGESGKFDVQNVATHELGHWLNLLDLYDSGSTEKTMYGYTSTGETKQRTLESDDIAGIKSIYGVTSSLLFSDYTNDNVKLANNTDGFTGTNDPLDVKISASIIKCTHADLKNNSYIIVTGKVKEILPSKWNTIDGDKPNKENTKSDQDCIIYTDIIISVDKYLKNPLSSKEVIVRTYGGKVGNDSMTLDIEAGFKSGENVLLYLEKDLSTKANDGSEYFYVYGSMQGKFTLTDDGKATRPDETVSQEELLSTIEK